MKKPELFNLTPEERATQIRDVMDTGFVMAVTSCMIVESGQFVPEALAAGYIGVIAMATSMFRAYR